MYFRGFKRIFVITVLFVLILSFLTGCDEKQTDADNETDMSYTEIVPNDVYSDVSLGDLTTVDNDSLGDTSVEDVDSSNDFDTDPVFKTDDQTDEQPSSFSIFDMAVDTADSDNGQTVNVSSSAGSNSIDDLNTHVYDVNSKMQAVEFKDMSEDAILKEVGNLFSFDYSQTGILASVSLGQFVLESDFGRSELAQNANNLFGMKVDLSGNTWPGSTWDGVSVYTKETSEQDATGAYHTITADFRKYDSIESCIADHSAYLLNSRSDTGYRYPGISGCDDYKKAAMIVKNGGYGTSLTYYDKLVSKIETYDLTKYDTIYNASDSGDTIRKLIAIDPGHQLKGDNGKEPLGPGSSELKTKVSGGTKGVVTGLPEYELVLQISLKLRDELKARGYDVLMVREKNEVNVSNAERAVFVNDAHADAFVRVHANGSENVNAEGIMTICQTASNPYNASLYKESRLLSDMLLDKTCSATGAKKERVWETDIMTGINWCQVPVSIIEVGYMTNPDEDKKLSTDEYQQKLAIGMADGIDAYFSK